MEGIVRTYLNRLGSLSYVLGPLMQSLNFMRAGEMEQIQVDAHELSDEVRPTPTTPFRNAFTKVFEPEDGLKILKEAAREVLGRGFPAVTIDVDSFVSFQRLLNRFHRVNYSHAVVEQSLFSSLTSLFDGFLGELLLELLFLEPRLLESCADTTVTYKELTNFDNIEDARKYVAERKVDAILHENPENMFKAIEKTFGVKLSPKPPALWSEFVEITQRRHLFQHTAGRVTKRYLASCRDAGVEDKKLPKLGSTVAIGGVYFRRAIRVFYEIGLKLSQVLWRKALTEVKDKELADRFLINEQYYAVIDEDWEQALMIGRFALDDVVRYMGSDINRRTALLNHAQALKWSGVARECETLLRGDDWSSCDPYLRLPVHVLLEEWGEAIELLKRNGADGRPSKKELLEWPIFREFRNRPEFKEAFQVVFGESFKEAASKYTIAAAGESAVQPDETIRGEDSEETQTGLPDETGS